MFGFFKIDFFLWIILLGIIINLWLDLGLDLIILYGCEFKDIVLVDEFVEIFEVFLSFFEGLLMYVIGGGDLEEIMVIFKFDEFCFWFWLLLGIVVFL